MLIVSPFVKLIDEKEIYKMPLLNLYRITVKMFHLWHLYLLGLIVFGVGMFIYTQCLQYKYLKNIHPINIYHGWQTINNSTIRALCLTNIKW